MIQKYLPAFSGLYCSIGIPCSSDRFSCTRDQFQTRKLDIDFAVQAIHSLNVKHGDLRLPNITIDSNDRIRILDFGMSSISDQSSIIDPYQVED